MRRRGVTGNLLVLAIGAVLFIPLERLLDSWFPGDHMGFGLMGIWVWIVLPATILLALGLSLSFPRFSRRSAEHARRIEYLGWFLTALLYAAATWLYRKTS